MSDSVCTYIGCKNNCPIGDFHNQCLAHRSCIEKLKLIPCKLCEATFNGLLQRLDSINPINNVWNNMILKLKKKRRKLRGDDDIWVCPEDERRFTFPIRDEESLMVEIMELEKAIEETQGLTEDPSSPSNENSDQLSELKIDNTKAKEAPLGIIAKSKETPLGIIAKKDIPHPSHEDEESLMLEIMELEKAIEETQGLTDFTEDTSGPSNENRDQLSESKGKTQGLTDFTDDTSGPSNENRDQLSESKIDNRKAKETPLGIIARKYIPHPSHEKRDLLRCALSGCRNNLKSGDFHPLCFTHRTCIEDYKLSPCEYCYETFSNLAESNQSFTPRYNLWCNIIRKLQESRLKLYGDEEIFKNEEDEKHFTFPISYPKKVVECEFEECHYVSFNGDTHKFCMQHRGCIDEYNQISPCTDCMDTFKNVISVDKIYYVNNLWSFILKNLKEHRLKNFNDECIWKFPEDEEYFDLHEPSLYLHYEPRPPLGNEHPRKFLRLYIGELEDIDMTEDDVKKHFEQFGEIVKVRLEEETIDGKTTRDFGFIIFSSPQGALKAFTHGCHKINGKEITLTRLRNSFNDLKVRIGAKKQTNILVFHCALEDCTQFINRAEMHDLCFRHRPCLKDFQITPCQSCKDLYNSCANAVNTCDTALNPFGQYIERIKKRRFLSFRDHNVFANPEDEKLYAGTVAGQCDLTGCNFLVEDGDFHTKCVKHRYCFKIGHYVPCSLCEKSYDNLCQSETLFDPLDNFWHRFITKMKLMRCCRFKDQNIWKTKEDEARFRLPMQLSSKRKCKAKGCSLNLIEQDTHVRCMRHRYCIDESYQLTPCEFCISTFKNVVNAEKVYPVNNFWNYLTREIEKLRKDKFGSDDIWAIPEDAKLFNIEDSSCVDSLSVGKNKKRRNILVIGKCDFAGCSIKIEIGDFHTSCPKHRDCFSKDGLFTPCLSCEESFNKLCDSETLYDPFDNFWSNLIQKMKLTRCSRFRDPYIWKIKQDERRFMLPMQLSEKRECQKLGCATPLIVLDTHKFCLRHRVCIDESHQLTPCEFCVSTFRNVVAADKVYPVNNLWNYIVCELQKLRKKEFACDVIWKRPQDAKFFNIEDPSSVSSFRYKKDKTRKQRIPEYASSKDILQKYTDFMTTRMLELSQKGEDISKVDFKAEWEAKQWAEQEGMGDSSNVKRKIRISKTANEKLLISKLEGNNKKDYSTSTFSPSKALSLLSGLADQLSYLKGPINKLVEEASTDRKDGKSPMVLFEESFHLILIQVALDKMFNLLSEDDDSAANIAIASCIEALQELLLEIGEPFDSDESVKVIEKGEMPIRVVNLLDLNVQAPPPDRFARRRIRREVKREASYDSLSRRLPQPDADNSNRIPVSNIRGHVEEEHPHSRGDRANRFDKLGRPEKNRRFGEAKNDSQRIRKYPADSRSHPRERNRRDDGKRDRNKIESGFYAPQGNVEVPFKVPFPPPPVSQPSEDFNSPFRSIVLPQGLVSSKTMVDKLHLNDDASLSGNQRDRAYDTFENVGVHKRSRSDDNESDIRKALNGTQALSTINLPKKMPATLLSKLRGMDPTEKATLTDYLTELEGTVSTLEKSSLGHTVKDSGPVTRKKRLLSATEDGHFALRDKQPKIAKFGIDDNLGAGGRKSGKIAPDVIGGKLFSKIKTMAPNEQAELTSYLAKLEGTVSSLEKAVVKKVGKKRSDGRGTRDRIKFDI